MALIWKFLNKLINVLFKLEIVEYASSALLNKKYESAFPGILIYENIWAVVRLICLTKINKLFGDSKVYFFWLVRILVTFWESFHSSLSFIYEPTFKTNFELIEMRVFENRN